MTDTYQAPPIPEDQRTRALQREAAGLLKLISFGILEADRTPLAEALIYLGAASSALAGPEKRGPSPLADPALLHCLLELKAFERHIIEGKPRAAGEAPPIGIRRDLELEAEKVGTWAGAPPVSPWDYADWHCLCDPPKTLRVLQMCILCHARPPQVEPLPSVAKAATEPAPNEG